ncbi:MAG TPA: antibiotic biosynthesis monooxygenase [Thermoplasmata archaeon]|nr:antibiotic biosynthesis monooxygenase [Thermoplasmata archaeon]
MIARTWHGVTAASKADAYLEVLQKSGLKEYRDTPGNQGVIVLRRTEGDRSHFLLITFWESFDAIRRFAGPNPERAVYYPKDKEFLLEFEPTVTHYDVLLSETDGDSEPRRP